MYICICNAITSNDLLLDYDSAIARCGTRCGACIDYIERGVYPGTDVVCDLLVVSTTKDTKTAK